MGEKARHYAIIRRLTFDKGEEVINTNSISKFEAVNESLQESSFAELGVNVIWIDDFSEIPNLLKRIKEDV